MMVLNQDNEYLFKGQIEQIEAQNPFLKDRKSEALNRG
jgi:hypothetical protein